MFKYIITIAVALIISSCGTTRKIVEVPVESQIQIRDSTVYVHDTVRVDIPVEVTRVVIPDVDTSHISTSFATSTAYLDTLERKIHHTLQQKGHIYQPIDTVITVQYITKEVQVPVYKDVEIPVTPDWAWYCLAVNILVVLVFIIGIILKLRK